MSLGNSELKFILSVESNRLVELLPSFSELFGVKLISNLGDLMIKVLLENPWCAMFRDNAIYSSSFRGWCPSIQFHRLLLAVPCAFLFVVD
jgi:hypothetical protein